MTKDKDACLACGGTGLQADDEKWQYPCTVCGGDGIFRQGDDPEPAEHFSVDPTNRTLE